MGRVRSSSRVSGSKKARVAGSMRTETWRPARISAASTTRPARDTVPARFTTRLTSTASPDSGAGSGGGPAGWAPAATRGLRSALERWERSDLTRVRPRAGGGRRGRPRTGPSPRPGWAQPDLLARHPQVCGWGARPGRTRSPTATTTTPAAARARRVPRALRAGRERRSRLRAAATPTVPARQRGPVRTGPRVRPCPGTGGAAGVVVGRHPAVPGRLGARRWWRTDRGRPPTPGAGFGGTAPPSPSWSARPGR